MTSIIEVILRPHVLRALTADSLPPPGPLILTSILDKPLEIASAPAFSAACAAAKGVLFLDPLNPKAPELDQEIALPYLSVRVIIVDLINAIPSGSTFVFFFFLYILAFAIKHYLLNSFSLVCYCTFFTFSSPRIIFCILTINR